MITPWSSVDPAQFADPADDLFASWLWFNLIAHAAPPPHRVPAGLTLNGTTLPLWCRARAGALVPVEGLTSPYSLEFRPILREPTKLAQHLVRHVRGVVRLDALDPADPSITAFERAATEVGLAIHRFSHFSNWFMPVQGDFASWLASRPGALRNTIKRRIKAAAALELRCFGLRFAPTEPNSQPIDLDQAVVQFEAVYAASWKPPEPFARVNAQIMRGLASAHVLRVGILADQAGPIAAQYWAVSGRRAYLLKLAYIKTAAARSPGTVLTALMIKSILSTETIDHLDFGRGEDRYKRDWVSQQQPRVGLLLINKRSASGVAMLARLRLAALRRAYLRSPQPVSPSP